jgi:phosphoserine phosphatase
VVASTSSAAHLRSQDLSEISSAGANTGPLTVLIVVPTLQAGAAAAGAVELVRILSSAGHQPLVVSSGGRMA